MEVNGDIYKGIKYLLWLHYYEYKFILYIFNKIIKLIWIINLGQYKNDLREGEGE